MFTVDKYLGKKYHAYNYNCWHLVRDCINDIFGLFIEDLTPEAVDVASLRDRVEEHKEGSYFYKIDDPISPCLVVMERPKSAPHIGLYYSGKVLHLQKCGVQYQHISIAVLGYQKVSFYRCRM